MKKIITILGLLTFVLEIAGCNQKTFIKEDVINIRYNQYIINTMDYSNIVEILNQLNFYCGKNKQYDGQNLSISTTNSVINFTLSNNYYMEYQKDNKYCYTKNKEKVKELSFLLEETINKYTNNNFYTIEFIVDYEENNKENNIRLDKGNEYVVIKFNEPITNFKKKEIELKDNLFEEINLLYSQELVNLNTIVIRKKIEKIPNYKISFSNKYGYTFNIIPTYDEVTDNIKFNTEIK